MDRRSELEVRLLEILEGNLNEDSYIDNKVELPVSDVRKSARRIAALCNQARGSEAVWVLGVANDGSLVGVGTVELNPWWSQVKACFSGEAPSLTNISISFEGKRFHGLFFDTSSPPYVVRPQQGSDLLEVPMRDGTDTRSANRTELARILLPVSRNPLVESVAAELYVRDDGRMQDGVRVVDGVEEHRWLVQFKGKYFLEPESPITFPRHRLTAKATLPLPGVEEQHLDVSINLLADNPGSTEGTHFMKLEQPAMIVTRAVAYVFLPISYEGVALTGTHFSVAEVEVRMPASRGSVPLVINEQLPYQGPYKRSGHALAPLEYVWSRSAPD